MTDIAQLGLAIDSSQANAATVALGNLQKAAAPAAQAMADLQSASAPAAQALNQINTASGNFAAGSDTASESLRGQRNVIRAISTDLAVFGTGVAQTVGLMGTLYIENSHLIEGFGGFTAAVKAIATPTNLMIGGILGIGAAMIAMGTSIAASEQQFSQLSDMSNTTMQSLHGLESAANLKGIDTTDFVKSMTTISTLTAQAQHNTGSLAELFQATNTPVGGLQQNLLSIASIMSNITLQSDKYRLLTSLGLPATQQMVNFLQQGGTAIQLASANAAKFGDVADVAFVQASQQFKEEWDAAWNTFENSAKTAFVHIMGFFNDMSAAKDSIMRVPQNVPNTPYPVQDTTSADAFSAVENRARQLAARRGASMPSMPLNSDQQTPGLQTPVSTNNSMLAAQPTSAVPYTQPNIQGPVLPEVMKTTLSQLSSQMGMLGPLATLQQTLQQKQLAINVANLAGAGITKDQTAAILDYTRATSLGITAIDQSTDAQKISMAADNMSVGAAAAYTAEQTKLQEAIRLGHPILGQDADDLHTAALALGNATQAASVSKAAMQANFQTMQLGMDQYTQASATQMFDLYKGDWQNHMNDALASQIKMNAALNDMKGAASNAMGTFLTDLKNGKSMTDSLQDAISGLEDKMINIASNQLISSMFAAATSGAAGTTGGGLLSLFGVHHTGYGPGDAYPTRAVDVSAFANAPRFHTGVGPGERAAVIRDDESVLTPGQMKALGAMISTSNSSPAPAATTPPQVNIGIQNYSGQPASVQQSSSAGGGTNFNVVIGQLKASIANDIARGGTSINTALERRYAVNPAVGNVR